MRKATLSLLFLAGVVLWGACESDAPTQPAALDPSFVILDGAHGGSPDFFWLPPMVDQPTFSGTFVGTLSPSVHICLMDTDIWNCKEGEEFSFEIGSGVEVDVHGQHYQVNWDTDEVIEGVDPIQSGYYRITVLLGPPPEGHLGFADVFIDDNAREFSHDGQTVELIDGRTLPIKFRIESGACGIVPADCDGIWDLAFHSDRDGDLDVYVMDLETGIQFNITPEEEGLDGTANWHPDGSRLVFASDRADPGASPDIYTMNPDGSDVQFLAEDGWQPEYSPDGSKIVFQRGWPPEPDWPGYPSGGDSDPTGREHDIWLMDADGTNQVQLTDIIPANWLDLWEDFSPTWHPTENWVSFGRARNTLLPNVQPDIDCRDPEYTPSDQQEWWDDPRHYCYFDVASLDVTDPSDPVWIRHTYDLQVDQLGPRWSPEGVLTIKVHADEGFIVALLSPPTSLAMWPGPFQFLTPVWPGGDGRLHGTEDGNITWATDGPGALFSSMRLGPVGIFRVENWADWLTQGPPYPQGPLVVHEGQMNDWARFRPR